MGKTTNSALTVALSGFKMYYGIMNANPRALAHGQHLMDTYANAMQSGTHGIIPMELGVGQVARIQEAAATLGLNLAIIGPFSMTREKAWETMKDADVILLDGALDQKVLPGKILAKSLLAGHFFEKRFEKQVTVLIRTSRPEAFLGLPIHD